MNEVGAKKKVTIEGFLVPIAGPEKLTGSVRLLSPIFSASVRLSVFSCAPTCLFGIAEGRTGRLNRLDQDQFELKGQ
jgi:hypothetical protein